MIKAKGQLSEMIKHYVARRLPVEVQFAAIRETKNWLKLERNSKNLIVVDHKKKYSGEIPRRTSGVLRGNSHERSCGDAAFLG